jgi:sigma-B regulation protein RsbU (phosphoserine phosphatase)
MCVVAPEMSAAQVLSAFHRDAPYLFLGAAFVAVGMVSAAFSALRRKQDPLLLYFALYAVLYGIRLWIQAELLEISIHESWFYPRLRSGINYIVPIPAILFFNAAGLLRGAGKIAGNILIIASSVLATATLLLGPASIYDRFNSVVVIAAMIAFVAQFTRSEAASADFAIIRRGLLTFAAFVVWDNLRGVFRFSLPSLEPFGFAVFLGSLGYVAARRTLQRDQQLSEIRKELEVARRIQLSILPAEFPDSPHFRVSARYLPMTSVAGDFYDYIIADQHQAGLLIADVSGHGVPAALIASMVKLAAAAQRAHATDPSAFLSHINAILCGNTQNQFVTAAYVHLDSAAQELRYSAAGHPPMLLLRRGQITEVEENGLMLAAFNFATYSNAIHSLEQGDRLLLYTDGIVEAANAAGDFFGPNALREVFRKTQGTTPSEAADLIVSTVQEWSNTQEDDLTVLVCDYVG